MTFHSTNRNDNYTALVTAVNKNSTDSLAHVINYFTTEQHDSTFSEKTTLENLVFEMLQALNETFEKNKEIPVGTENLIEIMNQIISCKNEEEQQQLIHDSLFLDNLAKTMEQVNSSQSNLNYVTATLQILAAIALFAIILVALWAIILTIGYNLFILVPSSGIATTFNATIGYYSYYTYSAAATLAQDVILYSSVIAAFLAPLLAAISPISLISNAINNFSQTIQAQNHSEYANHFNLFNQKISRMNQDQQDVEPHSLNHGLNS